MRAHLYLCAFTCTSMLSLCISARVPACARNPRAVQARTHAHVCTAPPWGPLGAPSPALGTQRPPDAAPSVGLLAPLPTWAAVLPDLHLPKLLFAFCYIFFFLFLPRELPFVALVPSRSVKGAGFEVSPPLPEEVFATLCRSCWHFALRSRLCGCSCDGASSQRLRAAPPAPQPSPHVAPTQHGATCTDSG